MTSSSFYFHQKLLQHKLRKLKQGSNPLEKGFTLIELLVVLIIIAILITLGLQTFNGVRDAAASRAAQFFIGQEAKLCTASVVGDFDFTATNSAAGNQANIPDGVNVVAPTSPDECDRAALPDAVPGPFCAEGGFTTITSWTVTFDNQGFPIGPPVSAEGNCAAAGG